jgi:hypothetical protein
MPFFFEKGREEMALRESLFVSACLVPGPGGAEWYPHLVNNQPLPNWDQGPSLEHFIAQLEAEGWQLARTYPASRLVQTNTMTLLFKRPKHEDSALHGEI